MPSPLSVAAGPPAAPGGHAAPAIAAASPGDAARPGWIARPPRAVVEGTPSSSSCGPGDPSLSSAPAGKAGEAVPGVTWEQQHRKIGAQGQVQWRPLACKAGTLEHPYKGCGAVQQSGVVAGPSRAAPLNVHTTIGSPSAGLPQPPWLPCACSSSEPSSCQGGPLLHCQQTPGQRARRGRQAAPRAGMPCTGGGLSPGSYASAAALSAPCDAVQPPPRHASAPRPAGGDHVWSTHGVRMRGGRRNGVHA